MKVTVTQKNIDQGIQMDATRCAIANALLDAGECGVSVEVPTVILGDDCYRLPKDIVEWACRFDKNKALVEPVSFELEEDIREYD